MPLHCGSMTAPEDLNALRCLPHPRPSPSAPVGGMGPDRRPSCPAPPPSSSGAGTTSKSPSPSTAPRAGTTTSTAATACSRRCPGARPTGTAGPSPRASSRPCTPPRSRTSWRPSSTTGGRGTRCRTCRATAPRGSGRGLWGRRGLGAGGFSGGARPPEALGPSSHSPVLFGRWMTTARGTPQEEHRRPVETALFKTPPPPKGCLGGGASCLRVFLPGVCVMTAYQALIRPSGEDAMGKSCILDPPRAGGCPQ